MDPLLGLKENVIIGKLIPAGTGMSRYRNIQVLHPDQEDEELDGGSDLAGDLEFGDDDELGEKYSLSIDELLAADDDDFEVDTELTSLMEEDEGFEEDDFTDGDEIEGDELQEDFIDEILDVDMDIEGIEDALDDVLEDVLDDIMDNGGLSDDPGEDLGGELSDDFNEDLGGELSDDSDYDPDDEGR
jgi:hypothetical protein